jgi:hypothetical protein
MLRSSATKRATKGSIGFCDLNFPGNYTSIFLGAETIEVKAAL